MSKRTIWRLLEVGEEARPGRDFYVPTLGSIQSLTSIRVMTLDHCAHVRKEKIPTCQYPAPRYDDPAKCGDPGRMILEWSQGPESGSWWGCDARRWTPGRPWLEQPPAPCKLKSEAEAAWEKHCGADQNPWLQNEKHAKQLFKLFIAGFNAAKGK